MDRSELVSYLDDFLHVDEIKDYGPQGLQVETDNAAVSRIALAVDTSPAIIRAAAEWQADMLLVHHGIFWGSMEPIAGPFGQRVRLLIQNGINLYGAHLCLDAHPEVGNNAVLAQMLNVQAAQWWCEPMNTPIGIIGSPPPNTTVDSLAERLTEELQITPRILANGPQIVSNVAILSGFGADHAKTAAALGADTFVTGETSHAHYWAASDYGMNIIYAGHYATETVGVIALGNHLAQRFDLQVKFFDFPTEM